MDNKMTYDSRVENVMAAVNHREPDYIPVINNLVTWPAEYKKVHLTELFENEDKYVDVFSSFLDEVYADACWIAGIPTNISAYKALECDVFQISPNGYSVQHHEKCWMEADEYPALIADAKSFLLNVIAPRKFKALQGDKETVKKKLVAAMREIKSFGSKNRKLVQTVKDKYGICQIRGPVGIMSPFDIIFDRLRGFANTLTDVKRHPQPLKEATEAIAPVFLKPVEKLPVLFPFVGHTPHAPTYLGRKNFEEFYWPSYEKMLRAVASQGGKAAVVFEGTWKPLFEYLNSIPGNTIMGFVEEDDPFEAKKIIGDKVTLIAGVKVEAIKFKSKDVIFDLAKKIIDELAPGGGFMFSSDKALLSVADVNNENYIALQSFVHEYGRKK